MSNLPEKSDSAGARGLGDSIAQFTAATRLDKVAEQVARLAGAKDCGCKKRQQTLNQIFPYNTQQSQSPFPRKST